MEVRRYPVSTEFEVTLFFHRADAEVFQVTRKQDLRQMIKRLRQRYSGIQKVQVFEIRIKDLTEKYQTLDEGLEALISDEQKNA